MSFQRESTMHQHKISISTIALILLFQLFSFPQQNVANEGFSDLDSASWAKSSIYFLNERGTIAGYRDGRFGPHDQITRAQAVAILVRELYGESTPSTTSLTFSDVPKDYYFFDEIVVATEKGLIGGFPDKTFRPNDRISRAETAAILSRAYQIERGIHPTNITDISEAKWAVAPIQRLASNQLIGGYLDQTFRPNRSVTRAEFAAFVTRAIQYKPVNFTDSDSVIEQMSLEQKIGQMLMPDLRTWNGKNTTSVNPRTLQLLQEYHVGGMILFEKNIVNTEQMVTFTDELQNHVGGVPLFISADQEGGSVKRIPKGTNMPGNMALGSTRSPELAYQAGNVMGKELDALGFNLNFAPILDVNVNPKNPIIGIRSFGEDPQLVSDLGVSFIDGLRDANVIATVKHFPGHGDTVVDSHHGLPELPHNLERLEQVELKPFRAAIKNGIDMIMTAHITFPAIDDTTVISKKDGGPIAIPATLSKKVLTGLLREQLQYDGIIVTDAFTMKAIADHFGEEEAAIKAVNAGADIILMPQNIDKVFYALVDAVEQGEISETTIDQSVKRILELKVEHGLFENSASLSAKLENMKRVVASEQHRAIEQNIAEKAISVEKSEKMAGLTDIKDSQEVTIIAPQKSQLDKLVTEARKVAGNRMIKGFTYAELQHSDSSQIVKETDYLILATYQHRSTLDLKALDKVQSLVNTASEQGKGYVVMSLGDPYENIYIQGINNFLATYGDELPNIKAGLNVIFQQLEPTGVFPVSLK